MRFNCFSDFTILLITRFWTNAFTVCW